MVGPGLRLVPSAGRSQNGSNYHTTDCAISFCNDSSMPATSRGSNLSTGCPIY
jgi:hypothetical protein